MKEHKKQILISNTTTENVQEKIRELPKRFAHYTPRDFTGVWSLRIIRAEPHRYVIQLVDKTFEPTRDIRPDAPHDAPHIVVDIVQLEKDVSVVYYLKWKQWKVWFAGLFFLFLLIMCSASVYLRDDISIGELLSYLGSFILYLWWLVSNIKHDQLTLRVFAKLMGKTFA